MINQGSLPQQPMSPMPNSTIWRYFARFIHTILFIDHSIHQSIKMKRIAQVVIVLWIILVSPWLFAGVSLPISYHYRQVDQSVVYQQEGYKTVVLSHLPQVNAKAIRAVPLVLIENASKSLPFFQEQSDDENRYFTDGQYVLWNGKIMANGEEQPAIDIATFQASGAFLSFATDQHSVYINGERVGDNTGERRVNLTKLQTLGVMKSDGNSLYGDKGYLGLAAGYREIKSYHVRPNFKIAPPILLVISANHDHVFVNTTPIPNADPETFRLVRWLPRDGYLSYQDKNGQHFIEYGRIGHPQKSPSKKALDKKINASLYPNMLQLRPQPLPFLLGTHQIFYAIDEENKIPIPHVDPEWAQVYRPNVVSDGKATFYWLDEQRKIHTIQAKQIFQLKNGNPTRLDYVPIVDDVVIDDGQQLYFVRDGKGIYAQYTKTGDLKLMGDYWAVDAQYVYILSTGQRFKTSQPEVVQVTDKGLSTSEGVYLFNGSLVK